MMKTLRIQLGFFSNESKHELTHKREESNEKSTTHLISILYEQIIGKCKIIKYGICHVRHHVFIHNSWGSFRAKLS